MSETKIAKAGKLLLVDVGQYSDYTVIAFFVVLKDFDPMRELEEYKIEKPDRVEEYRFGADSFLAVLLAKGYLLEVEHDSLYLGSYGSCDDVKFRCR